MIVDDRSRPDLLRSRVRVPTRVWVREECQVVIMFLPPGRLSTARVHTSLVHTRRGAVPRLPQSGTIKLDLLGPKNRAIISALAPISVQLR
jgi:hypothetical protein